MAKSRDAEVLLTTEEFIARWHLSRRTIKRYVRRGLLHPVQDNPRKRLFPLAEIRDREQRGFRLPHK
jgi:hypothetical protein